MMWNVNDDGPEQVVLVDESDKTIGLMEKLAAHREGMLHRAFSVFIFHPDGRLMLQQRALSKYHSPGLWSNTCCGHPRPVEDVLAAATRRTMEEMGLSCDLSPSHQFIYRAELGGGLIEHELDHVFTGISEHRPHPAASEVADWRYVERRELALEMEQYPGRFSSWFPLCVWRAWDDFEVRNAALRNT